MLKSIDKKALICRQTLAEAENSIDQMLPKPRMNSSSLSGDLHRHADMVVHFHLGDVLLKCLEKQAGNGARSLFKHHSLLVIVRHVPDDHPLGASGQLTSQGG